jgi:hypothetical protein
LYDFSDTLEGFFTGFFVDVEESQVVAPGERLQLIQVLFYFFICVNKHVLPLEQIDALLFQNVASFGYCGNVLFE